MLHLRYRDWTPVRIENASSVAYLNELFAAGWYLMDLDLGELKCLAFDVPASPPTRDERRMLVIRPGARTPHFVVVIVARGRVPRRQIAIYHDPGTPRGLPPGGHGTWRPFYVLASEDGGVVVIFERKDVEEESRGEEEA